jgi:glutamyl-tRNA reductase
VRPVSAVPTAAGAAGPARPPALLLVGTDHRTAPVELREKASYGATEAEGLLVHLLARPEIGESAVVSTCNRTEVYVQPREEDGAYRTVLALAFRPRAPELEEQGRLYVKRQGDAAHHLLAVASGLESMVLGEPEILGQVKQAAALAEAVGASGVVLGKLFKAALTAGKRARAETAIATGAVSLGYAVVELARNIFQRLDETRTLVVGAGEIARAVARNLSERGIRDLTVANRSAERTAAFLEDFPDAAVVAFEERAQAVAGADLVIAATGAEEPILTRDHFVQAMHQRPGRSLLVVDLGVPRNVDLEARRVENLFLHDIDSLESLIGRNLKRRREEVPRVEEIVGEELARFYKWHRGLAVEPVIASLQKQAEGIRRQELAGALARFPPELHGDLDRLTRSLVRKILHHPSSRLRARNGEEPLPQLDLVRELFRLEDEED